VTADDRRSRVETKLRTTVSVLTQHRHSKSVESEKLGTEGARRGSVTCLWVHARARGGAPIFLVRVLPLNAAALPRPALIMRGGTSGAG